MEYQITMSEKVIKLVSDFTRKPFGRYRSDYQERSGQAFREDLLVPSLKEYDHVHVDLDGYNRYGRSFLDEAFGGLIREEGFEKSYLDSHLSFSHSLLDSVNSLIEERIQVANEDKKRK